MNYTIISCTDQRYVGWQVTINRLHRGLLKITRIDGAAATFPVDVIVHNTPLVTLANSNFVAMIQEI